MYRIFLFILLLFIYFIGFSCVLISQRLQQITSSMTVENDRRYLCNVIDLFRIILYLLLLYLIINISFHFTDSELLNSIIAVAAFVLSLFMERIPYINYLFNKLSKQRCYSYNDILLLYGLPLKNLSSESINYANLSVIRFTFEDLLYVFEINPKNESVISFYIEENNLARDKSFIVKNGCLHWSSFINHNPLLADKISDNANPDSIASELISFLKKETHTYYDN